MVEAACKTSGSEMLLRACVVFIAFPLSTETKSEAIKLPSRQLVFMKPLLPVSTRTREAAPAWELVANLAGLALARPVTCTRQATYPSAGKPEREDTLRAFTLLVALD